MGKYLLVNSSDIYIENYKKCKNDNSINNLENSLESLFNMYNIPNEYQKIAIHMCLHNIYINADAREMIYYYPFDITGKAIIEKNNKKIVTGVGLKPIIYNNKLAKINFQTPIEFLTKEEVFEFYYRIHKDGYFEDYMRLFVQLFNVDVDIDLLLDINAQESNKRKVLKLYKKEIESRNKDE